VAPLAGLAVLPEIRAERGARLPDVLSVVAVFLAITLVTLVIVQGPQWGWSSPAGLVAALAALVATAVAVWRTLCHPRAVIEASLFRNQRFAGATLALFVYFVGFATFLLVTVLFLQDLWHFDALQTGLAIAPGPLVAAVLAINSGPISARFGPRAAAVAGPLCVAIAALFWLGVASGQPNYLLAFLPGMLVGGIGAGLTQAPLLASATGLPDNRATTGSAVLNMARQVGSALGVALTVMLIASAPAGSLDGFRNCWWLMIGVMLAAAAISLRAAPARTRQATVGSSDA
jgi:predicted MFS family arabinose efflux permease